VFFLRFSISKRFRISGVIGLGLYNSVVPQFAQASVESICCNKVKGKERRGEEESKEGKKITVFFFLL